MSVRGIKPVANVTVTQQKLKKQIFVGQKHVLTLPIHSLRKLDVADAMNVQHNRLYSAKCHNLSVICSVLFSKWLVKPA